MGLRLKVITILTSISAFLAIFIYWYSKITFLHEYEKIEENYIVENISRSNNALERTTAALKVLNADWTVWDEAYRFVEDRNQQFINSNLVLPFYEIQKLNFNLFFNTTGKLVFGQSYDLAKHKFIPVPPGLLNYLHSHPSLLTFKHLKESHAGILKIPEGYVMLSSMPIRKGNAEGPARGAVVMGYFLNEKYFQALSDIVEVKINFFPLPSSDPKLQNIYHQLLKNDREYKIITTPKVGYGYFLIKDIEGKDVAFAQVVTPRATYLAGVKFVSHYLWIMALACLILLVVTWYLFKIFVLDRMLSIGKQVIDAKATNNFSARIAIDGNDELNDLVAVLNSLLQLIELTQEQLKFKIFQHTEKLEHLSLLNKNLFFEVNRQKALESKLKQDEGLLRQMAYHDALTGLPNRIFLREFLKKAIDKSEREGEGFSLLFLDIDKFKDINDTYGHDVGDKFLQYIAMQLKKSVREGDFVVRLSGDEFIVLLSDTNQKNQIDIQVAFILKNLSQPLNLDGLQVRSTVSIGVSIYPSDGLTVEELEKNADLAMYYAKKQTGNAYCYFDSIPHDLKEKS